jgi:GR25 family glycosyltransferase involved in LPS biosynthesis
MQVYYINLDDRPDRIQHLNNEFIHFPSFCEFNRISAIKYRPGGIGCSRSHIKAIEQAKSLCLPYVFIIEDDIEIINKDGFKESLESIKQYIDSNSDWTVICIGAVPEKGGPKFIKCTDNLMYINNVQTTVAYIVNMPYYDTLLNNYKEGLDGFIRTHNYPLYALDQHWKKLQLNDKWLCANPILIKQKEMYSSIENANINYDCYYNRKYIVLNE